MEPTSDRPPLFVVDRIVQQRVLVQSGTIEEAASASRHIAPAEWVPGHSDLVEVFPVDPAIRTDLIAFQDLHGSLGERIEQPIEPDEPAVEYAGHGLSQVAIHPMPVLRLVSRIVRDGYQPDGKRSKVAWLHALSDYTARELRALLVEEVVAAIRRGSANVAPEARFAVIAEGTAGGSRFSAQPTFISGSHFPPADVKSLQDWIRDTVDWPDVMPPLESWILDELAAQYARSCKALLVDLLYKRIESLY